MIDCPFCDEQFSGSAFLAEEGFFALYNIAPILPGHSLVVPAKHVESLFCLSNDEISKFFVFARKATDLLIKAFNGDGFDWSLQEKATGGQTVNHLHLHIVIRRNGDLEDPGEWYPLVAQNDKQLLDSLTRPKLSKDEYRKITDYLRNYKSA